MGLLRIVGVKPLEGYRVQLRLTDGSTIERDIGVLLVGRVFDEVRQNPALFRAVGVEAGTLVWPNGADLCPDVVIWGGSPPSEVTARPEPVSPESSIRS
jgi:hypothetical protein